jgi:integration host factor subunit alpha
MADRRTLTKDILSDIIREKVGFPMGDSKKILEMTLEIIKAALEKGEDVKISGFGRWTLRNKRDRAGRNPHTGEKLNISARRVVTFHPSDILRERIDPDRSGG